MRLVVFGATGGLGTYLRKECEKQGVDFVNAKNFAVEARPASEWSDTVFVNCVGFGDGKKCEEDPLLSLNYNALCVMRALEFIKLVNAWGRPLIHISTNDVFSDQERHHAAALLSPVGVYDMHKTIAEANLFSSYKSHHIIMRGTFMSPFSKSKGGETFYYLAYKTLNTFMPEPASAWPEPVLGYKDQQTCPVSVDTYAEAILRVARDYERYLHHQVVHVSLGKPCSRLDVLEALHKHIGKNNGLWGVCETPPKARRNSYIEPSFGFCYNLEEEVAKFVKVCEEYERNH